MSHEIKQKVLHLPTGNIFTILFMFPNFSNGVLRKTSLILCPGVSCKTCPFLVLNSNGRQPIPCHGQEVPIEQFELFRE